MNEKWLNDFIYEHLGVLIDKNKDRLLKDDEIYKKDCEDFEDLQARYEALELAKKDRMLINDFIALIESRSGRVADLAYLAGAGDTVKLLHSLGAIKNLEE